MYILKDGNLFGIASSKEAIQLAEEIILSDQYEFAVFDGYSKDSLMYGLCSPEKRRYVYVWGENGDYPYSDGSWTTVGMPNIAVIKMSDLLPTIYLTGLGFPNRNALRWKGTRVDEAIDLAEEFTKEKRLLFYGETGRPPRERQLKFLERKGWKVVCEKVDISKKPLLETMRENRCGMILGMDGVSIGCWRDYEVPLSSVLGIRISETRRAHFAVDPMEAHYCVFEDDYVDPMDTICSDLKSDTMKKRLLDRRIRAEYVCHNVEIIRALDAISHDWQYSKKAIENAAKNDLSHYSLVREWMLEWSKKIGDKKMIPKFPLPSDYDECNLLYLSDMKEREARIGHGTLGKNGCIGNDGDGRVRVKGCKPCNGFYWKTLFFHPPTRGYSCVKYNVPWDGELSGQIAYNESAGPKCPCTCGVFVNDKPTWNGILASKEDVLDFSVPVKQNEVVELRNTCPGDYGFMHVVWVNPVLRRRKEGVLAEIPKPSNLKAPEGIRKCEYWDDRTAIDVRHACMLYDFLVSMKFKKVLEVGCFRGASTTAFIEASKLCPEMEIHLCDTCIRPEVRKLIEGKTGIVVHEEMSSRVLSKEKGFDFVFVDGNHTMSIVSEEVYVLLEQKVPCVAAHDTSAQACWGQEFDGSTFIKVAFQAAPYYCIEDNAFRDGELTHRGMLFATREQATFEKIKEVYSKWCLNSPIISMSE